MLEKLGDTEYRSSWKKDKLVSNLEEYDAKEVLNGLTVAQLDDVLQEHDVSSSGRKAQKVERLMNLIHGSDEEDDVSVEQQINFDAELAQLIQERENQYTIHQARFKRLLKGIFQKYKGLSYVGWRQYSLNWNDGDDCPFEVKRYFFSYNGTYIFGSWGISLM